MTQLAPPSLTCSVCVGIGQRRSRFRRYSRTLLWLCLTSAVIVAIVVVAPHVLQAIHPGPTGGGG